MYLESSQCLHDALLTFTINSGTLIISQSRGMGGGLLLANFLWDFLGIKPSCCYGNGLYNDGPLSPARMAMKQAISIPVQWMEQPKSLSHMNHPMLFLYLMLKASISQFTLLPSGRRGFPNMVCPIETLSPRSSSGQYLLAGLGNGSVRIHGLIAPYDVSDLSHFWGINMHDNNNGAVTCMARTFDDKYVLSGGEDGNLFLYQANLSAPAEGEGFKKITVSFWGVS